MLLCMKGGSCTCAPLTSTLTLHPPFKKSGYGPVDTVHVAFSVCVYGVDYIAIRVGQGWMSVHGHLCMTALDHACMMWLATTRT